MAVVKAYRYTQYWHIRPEINYKTVHTSYTIRIQGSLLWVYWDNRSVDAGHYLPADYVVPFDQAFYFGTGCMGTDSYSNGSCSGNASDGTLSAGEEAGPGESQYGTDQLRLNVLIAESPNTPMAKRSAWTFDLDPPPSETQPISMGVSALWIDGLAWGPFQVYLDGILYGSYPNWDSIWPGGDGYFPWLKYAPGNHVVKVVQGNNSGQATVNVGYDMGHVSVITPPQYGSLEGHVTSNYNGSPVAGATVSIGTLSAVTDPNGYYRIDKIPYGAITVDCSAAHFSGGAVATGYVGSPIQTLDLKLTPLDYIFITAFGGPGSGTTSNWPPNLSPFTLPYGYPITLKATANAGSYFDHWELNGVVHDENPITFTIGGDTTLVAVFSIVVKRTLTISYGGTGTGTTNPAAGSHQYDDGTVVTVQATADPGSTFDHWESV